MGFPDAPAYPWIRHGQADGVRAGRETRPNEPDLSTLSDSTFPAVGFLSFPPRPSMGPWRGQPFLNNNESAMSASDIGKVMTVLGPIAPEDLGVTYTHEHLLLDAMNHYPTASYGFIIDDEDLVVKELGEFVKRGGRTICDVTLDEIGRNPEGLKRIARRAEINVVMGCAFYREFGYPKLVDELTSNQLADYLVREIEVGVRDTAIRPGLIGEIGTGRGHIKPAEERVFRAAAIAQARTGIPITTHTTRWGTLALEQIAMLREYGADLSNVIIGHLGDRIGVKHLLPIA